MSVELPPSDGSIPSSQAVSWLGSHSEAADTQEPRAVMCLFALSGAGQSLTNLTRLLSKSDWIESSQYSISIVLSCSLMSLTSLTDDE